MNISFKEIYLFSKNPNLLHSFVSFVFDVDEFNFDLAEDKISFELDEIKFVILKSQKMIKEPYFSFTVKTIDELEEFKNKIEFFYYKQSMEIKNLMNKDDKLKFIDFDGRKWSVMVDSFIPPNIIEENQNTIHM